MSTLDAHLKALVEELSAELPEVTRRRMFGSDAFFANTNIYALIWDGRIVLRFSDEARFTSANALEGAEPFDPMGAGKGMRAWVVMPEELSDDAEALRAWVEQAHRGAMSLPPKAARKAKAEKVSTPRARARRTARGR